MNIFSYENNSEWKQPPMRSKMIGIRLKQGERVRLETPGGGGYGDPAARQAERRDKDTALGYVSAPALLKGKE